MKKTRFFLSFILIVYILSIFSMFSIQPVHALGKLVEVYDDAKLLTNEEILELKKYAKEYSFRTNINVFFVTTNDAQGKTAMEYADDFYDAITEKQEEYSGILFLIDMDNREIYISTAGNAITWLNDEEIEIALDYGFKYISKAKFGKCMKSMAEYALPTIEHWCEEGDTEDDDGNIRNPNPYMPFNKRITHSLLSFPTFIKKLFIGILGIIGVIISAILRALLGGGGGGHISGSSHRSSSGRSHGGGGRKF